MQETLREDTQNLNINFIALRRYIYTGCAQISGRSGQLFGRILQSIKTSVHGRVASCLWIWSSLEIEFKLLFRGMLTKFGEIARACICKDPSF